MADSKEQYAETMKAIKKRLDDGEYGDCPCPKTKCYWHGNCRDCVRLHRMGGGHVPACLQFILDDKIAALAATAELEVTRKPPRLDEFYDHVREVLDAE
ncbi:MAG: hypothetical protein ACYS8X_14210 [Planctomycetota bacterium]|jgi:hypothetical protein